MLANQIEKFAQFEGAGIQFTKILKLHGFSHHSNVAYACSQNVIRDVYHDVIHDVIQDVIQDVSHAVPQDVIHGVNLYFTFIFHVLTSSFLDIRHDFMHVFPHHSNGAYGCWNDNKIVSYTDIYGNYMHVSPHHSNGAYGC